MVLIKQHILNKMCLDLSFVKLVSYLDPWGLHIVMYATTVFYNLITIVFGLGRVSGKGITNCLYGLH